MNGVKGGIITLGLLTALYYQSYIRNKKLTKEYQDFLNSNKYDSDKVLELKKLPLIDYNTELALDYTIVDKLLSATYSKAFNQKTVKDQLVKMIFKHEVIYDVLSIVASDIAADQNKKFYIALLKDESAQSYTIPNGKPDPQAFYSTFGNYIYVHNNQSEFEGASLIHELTHKAMHVVFGENSCNPYNNTNSKEKFHQAAKNTLFNLEDLIIKHFEYEPAPLNISVSELGKYLHNFTDNSPFTIKENNTFYPEAMKSFLKTALSGFGYSNVKDYDSEIIARFPQLIAEGWYHGVTAQVFQPIAEFWHEEIHPFALQAFSSEQRAEDICLYSPDILDYFNYPYLWKCPLDIDHFI